MATKAPSFDDDLRRALSGPTGSGGLSAASPSANVSSTQVNSTGGSGVLGPSDFAYVRTTTEATLSPIAVDDAAARQPLDRSRDRIGFGINVSGTAVPFAGLLSPIHVPVVKSRAGASADSPGRAFAPDGLLPNGIAAATFTLGRLNLGADDEVALLTAARGASTLAFGELSAVTAGADKDAVGVSSTHLIAALWQNAEIVPEADAPASGNRVELSSFILATNKSADRGMVSSAKNAEITSRKEQDGSAKPEQISTRPTLDAVINPVAVDSHVPGKHGASPALDSRVAGQIADAILVHSELAAREGRTDFRMHLEPPELGSVRVHLTATDQGINGRILVHDHTARQMIQSHLDSLRQRLRDQGVSLGRLDVSGGDAGSSGRRGQTAEPAPAMDSAGSDVRRPNAAQTTTRVSAARAVDVVVY